MSFLLSLFVMFAAPFTVHWGQTLVPPAYPDTPAGLVQALRLAVGDDDASDSEVDARLATALHRFVGPSGGCVGRHVNGTSMDDTVPDVPDVEEITCLSRKAFLASPVLRRAVEASLESDEVCAGIECEAVGYHAGTSLAFRRDKVCRWILGGAAEYDRMRSERTQDAIDAWRVGWGKKVTRHLKKSAPRRGKKCPAVPRKASPKAGR